MKIRISALLFTAAAAVVSCTPRPALPRFETTVIDTLVGNGKPECAISYRFATIANAGDSPALQAVEQANIGYFFELEEFTGTASEAAKAAVGEIGADDLPDLPNAQTYEIAAEAEGSVVDTLICYVITRSNYLGGAHGMYGTECHIYSLADGYELAAKDLFTDSQLQRIDSLIRAKLYERYGVHSDDELSARGFFPEYIGATDNFSVTPEGITFHYNPYEIGCYALGALEVDLSREELDRIRK